MATSNQTKCLMRLKTVLILYSGAIESGGISGAAKQPRLTQKLVFLSPLKRSQIIPIRAGNSIIPLIRQAATFLACLTQGHFYEAISGNETEGSDWPISCLRKLSLACKREDGLAAAAGEVGGGGRDRGGGRVTLHCLTSTGSGVT